MILKTKREILNWLNKYDGQYQKNIRNHAYQVINIKQIFKENISYKVYQYFKKIQKKGHTFFVNVKGSVNLSNEKLKKIPFQFYLINQHFLCSNNQFKTLFGCPIYVLGDFNCKKNQLISLKYCPKSISGTFNCSYNNLNSLRYCADYIGKSFDCGNNKLISLKYCQESIQGDFYCNNNKLNSLEYGPKTINGVFFSERNCDSMLSLKYLPIFVEKKIYLHVSDELIECKNQSKNIKILEMDLEEFFLQGNLDFWYQIKMEKFSNQEKEIILTELNLDKNKEDNTFIKPKLKKV